MHSWRNEQRWPPYVNIAGETIPAHAVMRVDDRRKQHLKGGTLLDMGKPDGNDSIYAINGFGDALQGRYGLFTMDYPAAVLATGTLQTGDEIGPTVDSWKMSDDGSGFLAIGELVNDLVLVVPKLGGNEHFVGIANRDIPAGTKPAPPDLGAPGHNNGAKDVDLIRINKTKVWEYCLDSAGAIIKIPTFNMCLVKVDKDERVQGKRDKGKWHIDVVCCPA